MKIKRKRGYCKEAILNELKNGNASPTSIANNTGCSISYTSRIMKEFINSYSRKIGYRESLFVIKDESLVRSIGNDKRSHQTKITPSGVYRHTDHDPKDIKGVIKHSQETSSWIAKGMPEEDTKIPLDKIINKSTFQQLVSQELEKIKKRNRKKNHCSH